MHLGTTRIDTALAAHACARCSADPKEEHAKAVNWIGRCPAATQDKGMTHCPKQDEGFHACIDADFAGNWDQSKAGRDPDTAQLRAGFVVACTGCPAHWKSKLQTEISLSSAESEHIAAREAIRSVVQMMNLAQELKDHGFKLNNALPIAHCKVFEDNAGAVELLKEQKFCPRTKHINVKHHFFWSCINRKLVSSHKVTTELQPSDTLTKPLSMLLFEKHRKFPMGW